MASVKCPRMRVNVGRSYEWYVRRNVASAMAIFSISVGSADSLAEWMVVCGSSTPKRVSYAEGTASISSAHNGIEPPAPTNVNSLLS